MDAMVVSSRHSAIKELALMDTIPAVDPEACPKIKYLSVAHMFAEAISHIYTETAVSPLFT